MCNALPGRVVSVKGGFAKVKTAKGMREVKLVDRAKKGDDVLITMGYAVKK